MSATARALWPMRKMAQGTPRYIYHRTRQMLYERGHPDDPWLNPAAIRLLESLLRPADLGAEFGSGRSTIWFAKRVAALTSVEHDERWYKTVAAKPEERQLATVEYIVARPDQALELGAQSMYMRTARGFPDAGLDFALIDGNYRDYSAKMHNFEDQAGAGYSSSTTLTGICHQSHGHRIRIHGLSGPMERSGPRLPGNWLSGAQSGGARAYGDTTIFIRPLAIVTSIGTAEATALDPGLRAMMGPADRGGHTGPPAGPTCLSRRAS